MRASASEAESHGDTQAAIQTHPGGNESIAKRLLKEEKSRAACRKRIDAWADTDMSVPSWCGRGVTRRGLDGEQRIVPGCARVHSRSSPARSPSRTRYSRVLRACPALPPTNINQPG